MAEGAFRCCATSLRCLQHGLGSGLIEHHQVDGLGADCRAEHRCQYSNANSEFRHGELISISLEI